MSGFPATGAHLGELIALACNEITHLFNPLFLVVSHPDHILGWSLFRRSHQADGYDGAVGPTSRRLQLAPPSGAEGRDGLMCPRLRGAMTRVGGAD